MPDIRKKFPLWKLREEIRKVVCEQNLTHKKGVI